jgi:hypothetical protein
MTRNLTIRSLRFLTLAAALLATACQKGAETPPAASTASTTGTTGAGTAGTAGTPAPAAAPAPKVQVCTLLSAAEVSAVVGRTLVQDGCTYGLDPAAKEKAVAESQDEMAKSTSRAAAGDMNGFAKGMMQSQKNMGSIVGDQLSFNVEATRDDQTEDEVKAIFAKTSGAVRGATAPLSPEQRGLHGLLEGSNEISGVGDWAFATNVASVNMGMGFSVHGRLLEARKGPWRVTVSATVAPDPGSAALDNQLAGVARALIAKL